MRYGIFFITLMLALAVACAPVTQPVNDTVAEPVNDTAANDTTTQEPEEPSQPEPAAKFTVTRTEGDLVNLNPRAVDPDEDVIAYEFSDPFNENGEWQTQIGDEGTYHVTVTAMDGKGGRATETVRVIVTRANRPPVIDCSQVIVNEGEMLNLHDYCTISDEDDEKIVVTYAGWMTSWRKQIGYDDAGTHTVIITASDKRDDEILHTVKQNITVTVNNVNRAPVFSTDFPEVITATENDVVTIPRDLITDPDRDSVSITYSDPFSSRGVWRTELGDAGTYSIDVVATDGDVTAKRTVRVEIALLNTAPILQPIPDIEVDEGQKINLPISATDREGDALTIRVSGWMDSAEYQTTYDDAGKYTVKVSASDGEFTTDEIISITVRNVNRPPVFVTPA